LQEGISRIKVRPYEEWKNVKIGYGSKPDITSQVIDKWQKLLNLSAKIIGVPSGLIMQLKNESIQVFMKSQSDGNPYEVGEEAELKYGLYCETVIGTQKELIVANALESNVWKENNPDVGINMISYMGLPLNWPDGSVFGTVCVLDSKPNPYSDLYQEYLFEVKVNLEKDLQLISKNEELEAKNRELKTANEVKSKFLSLISHDIRSSLGSIKEYFSLVLNDFYTTESHEIYRMLNSLGKGIDITYEILINLLLWSKNELLELPIKKERINLSELVHDVIRKYTETASLKGIRMNSSGINDGVFVLADQTMLETSIRNVYSNAVKYSETDGTIETRLYRNSCTCNLEIEDHGIGMPPSIMETLFSYKEEQNRKGTKGETSSGIGLLLLYEFINRNNGKVEVESEEGRGTMFRLVFDMA
jgi:c-di-GMP phosphodiesterase